MLHLLVVVETPLLGESDWFLISSIFIRSPARLAFATPSPSARRLEGEDVTRLDGNGTFSAQIESLRSPNVPFLQQIDTFPTVFAARHSVRTQDSPLGQDGESEILAELYLSQHSVSAVEGSPAARSLRQRKMLQNDGVTTLQNLGICQPRVGHVDVDPGSAVPRGSCPRPASNSLVVANEM